MSILEMSESVCKLINGLCSDNTYTFSYYNIDKNNDTYGLLKNIPILSIANCL